MESMKRRLFLANILDYTMKFKMQPYYLKCLTGIILKKTKHSKKLPSLTKKKGGGLKILEIYVSAIQ